ncbi:MAG: Gfo/Idh/MocA family oxidoreductase [Clostridia bacterium]|nr:Gfo/Idh/MocA family oxidoreductase [Clostridia bacterium]
MSKKIKVGVIGCGRIANHAHLPSYKNNPDAEIVYVCDLIEEKAIKASNEYGGKAITDYKIILNDPEIDAISICTPNYCHASITFEALRAGKNVLCEKPAARTLDEAIEMQKVKNETGKILNIGVVNRFNDAVNKIKELVSQGELGNIHHVYMSFRSHRNIPGIGGDFTNKTVAGGGVLIDWGVHYLDLVMYVCGDPKAKTVSSEMFTVLGKNINDYVYTGMWAEDTAKFGGDGVCDVEESITGLIRTDGPVISFNGAWAQNIGEEDTFIDFMGDKAGIRLKYGGNFTLYSTKNNMLTKTTFEYKTGNMFQNEIDAYIKAIQENNDKLPSSINVNILTQEIMEAIYKSATEHKEVTL